MRRARAGKPTPLPSVELLGDEVPLAEIVAVRTTPGDDGAVLGRHGEALADQ